MLADSIRVGPAAKRAAATPVVVAVERPVSLPEERINRPVAERIAVLLETRQVMLAIDVGPWWCCGAIPNGAFVVARHDCPGRFHDLSNPITGQPETDANGRQCLSRLITANDRCVAPLQRVAVHAIHARSARQVQSVR